uniref:Putative secreted protein n=1 Tax=Anopheles darlingi TaxID=43151 RepID=A0A2M4D126_ANODA
MGVCWCCSFLAEARARTVVSEPLAGRAVLLVSVACLVWEVTVWFRIVGLLTVLVSGRCCRWSARCSTGYYAARYATD